MSFISQKGIYGLMAIFEISKFSPNKPISMQEIANKLNITKSYLEQILNPLRFSGIIGSTKGKFGGYFLNKNLDEISFIEILNALESDFSLHTMQVKDKNLSDFLEIINKKILNVFKIPLSDFVKFSKTNTKFLNYDI